ncbi:hypothetical protein ACHAXR_013020 [Thalassiosira sp. AJA248-18]
MTTSNGFPPDVPSTYSVDSTADPLGVASPTRHDPVISPPCIFDRRHPLRHRRWSLGGRWKLLRLRGGT